MNVYILTYLHDCMMQIVDEGRKRLSKDHHFLFRLFKLMLFFGVLSGIIIPAVIYKFSARDLIICCLAFLPTGWGLLSVSIK